MATMVCRVTPTFSASAAWVISPAWKRSVRTVLEMRGSPLPISADPIVDDLRGGEDDTGQHRYAEQRVGSEFRLEAEGLPDQNQENTDREHKVGVAHRLAVD